MKKAALRARKEEKNEKSSLLKEGKKNDKSSLLKRGEIMQRESVFGKYTDAEMLSQLKRIALDPCSSKVSQDSIRPLFNQTLRLRKVMTLGHTECPRVSTGSWSKYLLPLFSNFIYTLIALVRENLDH